MPTLPSFDTFVALPVPSQIEILDLLFEPNADLHSVALPVLQQHERLPEGRLTSYPAFVAVIRSKLLDLAKTGSEYPPNPGSMSSLRTLNSVLGSHPRLGAKKVESALSRAEQAQISATATTNNSTDVAAASEELEKKKELEVLRSLNEEYEAKFPGLRYVVWVNGRGRGEIIEDMKSRIERATVQGERSRGVEAMCDIALDRAAKMSN